MKFKIISIEKIKRLPAIQKSKNVCDVDVEAKGRAASILEHCIKYSIIMLLISPIGMDINFSIPNKFVIDKIKLNISDIIAGTTINIFETIAIKENFLK